MCSIDSKIRKVLKECAKHNELSSEEQDKMLKAINRKINEGEVRDC